MYLTGDGLLRDSGAALVLLDARHSQLLLQCAFLLLHAVDFALPPLFILM